MAKENIAKNKKIPKKTGPNEKIPESNSMGTFKAILIGVVVSGIIIFCVMSGYFDSFLSKNKDAVNVASEANSATTKSIPLSNTKTIPVNLPPKLTASAKNPPKATNVKSSNEAGYKVSGGETTTGEKGWIKEIVTPGIYLFIIYFLFIFF